MKPSQNRDADAARAGPSDLTSPNAEAPVEVLGLTEDALGERIRALLELTGEPDYRSRQLWDWIYRRTPDRLEDMIDLPRRVREAAIQSWILHPLAQVQDLKSTDGTRKFLWKRLDGGTVESVIIPDGSRLTFCISSQAGCPVRCTFCATGFGGFRGNLRSSEIVDQVFTMRRIAGDTPTNLVYMGMGEPLLNTSEVFRSIEILISPTQGGLGARRITVSTVGVPDGIRQLAERFPQVKLALSLHAASDALRDSLIPLNRKFPLHEVLEAVRDHARTTGKKATFEYVVLPGCNDSQGAAEEVIRRVRDIPSRINLLAFNPFPGAPFEKPSLRRVLRFREWLQAGFPGDVTVRRSRGEDIQGACGQLSLHESGVEPV